MIFYDSGLRLFRWLISIIPILAPLNKYNQYGVGRILLVLLVDSDIPLPEAHGVTKTNLG